MSKKVLHRELLHPAFFVYTELNEVVELNKQYNMKILIAYYSRTGVTRKIAEKLKEKLGCDIEEIESVKDRSGMGG